MCVTHELYQMHEFYPDKDVKKHNRAVFPIKMNAGLQVEPCLFGKHVLEYCVCVWGLCGRTSFAKETNLVFEEGGWVALF